MKLFYIFSIDYQLISHRRDVVAAAVKEGYEVTVVAEDTGYRKEIENMGVRFIELPINRVGTNPIEEMKTFKFLYKLYKREKPDIVHHVSMKVVLWGGLAAKFAKVSGVVNAINGLGVFFESGEVDSLVKRIFIELVRIAHKRRNVLTIFQNSEDCDFFVSRGAIKQEQTRRINGSGVNIEVFKETPIAKEYPLKMLFTSRMVEEKGVLDIIDAAKLLKPKYEGKICFLLCGLLETNPKAVNKETLDRECDGKYIQYLGQRNDVKELLMDSAIVLLPSYYREGIPKSLIEATAIGRPIITTDWIGCREAVVNNVNGFLIPIKSPKALAEKIELLINDESLRISMGKESRKIAVSKFSIDEVIRRHLKIYNEVSGVKNKELR
jgi:glycosyltransferase involved in cell wall biosynthesis